MSDEIYGNFNDSDEFFDQILRYSQHGVIKIQ